MHPNVARAIQEIDAALSKMALALDEHKIDGWKALGAAGADFIRSQLRRPSPSAPVRVRADGAWRDDGGVVHAVNATWIEPDIDLGRETACGLTAWDPDHPGNYPVEPHAIVDCMTCIVRQARSCP